jgi:hypothetical protein
MKSKARWQESTQRSITCSLEFPTHSAPSVKIEYSDPGGRSIIATLGVSRKNARCFIVCLPKPNPIVQNMTFRKVHRAPGPSPARNPQTPSDHSNSKNREGGQQHQPSRPPIQECSIFIDDGSGGCMEGEEGDIVGSVGVTILLRSRPEACSILPGCPVLRFSIGGRIKC